MSYFNVHPVTSDMGLRESVDAMLEHVAYNRHDFGYPPSAIHQANYETLLEDYGAILEDDFGVLVLKSQIKDSALLADLADTLVSLCNDYPSYDDERVCEIEHERLVSMLEEVRGEEHPRAEDIAWALFEIGACVEHSEYGVNVSDDDYNAAVIHAHNNK